MKRWCSWPCCAASKINASWFDLLQKTELLTHSLKGLGVILIRWKAWLDQLPPHDALQAIYADGDVLARFAVAAPATQRDTVLANLQRTGGHVAANGWRPFCHALCLCKRRSRPEALSHPRRSTRRRCACSPSTVPRGWKRRSCCCWTPTHPSATPRPWECWWTGQARRHSRPKFVFLASESQPPACAVATLEAERAERGREELNALYVALTRARHTLVLSSIEPYRDAQRSWWQRLNDLTRPLVEPFEQAPAPLVAMAPASVAADADTVQSDGGGGGGGVGVGVGGGGGGELRSVFYMKELPFAHRGDLRKQLSK
jgi:ATP-dependent helicase/nuclease subunit A